MCVWACPRVVAVSCSLSPSLRIRSAIKTWALDSEAPKISEPTLVIRGEHVCPLFCHDGCFHSCRLPSFLRLSRRTFTVCSDTSTPEVATLGQKPLTNNTSPLPPPPQHTKDFVSQQSQQGWADACKRVRYKTLPDTSHHTLLESGADYLEIIDDFLNEYD